jgi:hypothetical protein
LSLTNKDTCPPDIYCGSLQALSRLLVIQCEKTKHRKGFYQVSFLGHTGARMSMTKKENHQFIVFQAIVRAVVISFVCHIGPVLLNEK